MRFIYLFMYLLTFNWVPAMMMAEEHVNPVMTGWEIYRTKNPSRNTAINIWMIPVRKHSIIAKVTLVWNSIQTEIITLLKDWLFGWERWSSAKMRLSLEREVCGSNFGSVKSDTVLPKARHRCDISSNGAVLPERNDAEMGPANSLHASALYNE